MSLTWQEIAKKSQDYRDASIARVQPPSVHGDLPLNVSGIPRQLLSTREADITELAPEALYTLLAAGKLTSTEVTTAYLKRAAVAQNLVSWCRVRDVKWF
jgi:amidase